MAQRVLRIGHSAPQSGTFVGLDREITVDNDDHSLRVHDGATAGGFPTARTDASNIQEATTAQDGKMTAAFVDLLLKHEAEIHGLFNKTLTGDYTLIPDEQNNLFFMFDGALSADATVTFPDGVRFAIISNDTTGGYNVIIETVSGVATATIRAEAQLLIQIDDNDDVSIIENGHIQLSYAGDPNSNVTGVVGAQVWDTVSEQTWICTTAGIAAAAVWELENKTLIADLADTTDVAKGDALVGIKRQITGTVAGTIHDWLESIPLNLKRDFGAKFDARGDVDGAVSTGTPDFTSLNAVFTSADIGKTINIDGAGAAGGWLFTTIAAYVSGTAVTLTDNASTTVSGADYTYGTDDSAAWQAARDAIKNLWIKNPAPGTNTNKLPIVSIEVPEGQSLITEAESIMDGAVQRTVGVRWIAPGSALTQVLYQPSVSGPLLKNEDDFLNIKIEGIRFHGMDPASSFLESISDGGAQDYRFHDIQIEGSWKRIIDLTGTNNNSELVFNKFRVNPGTVIDDAFLYIGPTSTTDQFVNYWFNECSFWGNNTLIIANKGGHFHFKNLDVSGYAPSAGQYLFELLGTSHFAGTMFFSIQDARIELHNTDAFFMKCEWSAGNVTFRDLDMTANEPAVGNNFETFLLDFGNNPGPAYAFHDSELMGKMRLKYGPLAFERPNRLLLHNTSHPGFTDLDDVFIWEQDGAHGNFGGIPVVKLRECRTRQPGQTPDDGIYIWEADLGWHLSKATHMSRKLAFFKRGNGRSPKSGDTPGSVVLPPNSIIIGGGASLPSGAVVEVDAASFEIRTREGTPTVLHSWSAANHSLGYEENFTLSPGFRTGTDLLKRTLDWINDPADASASSTEAICFVEYFG